MPIEIKELVIRAVVDREEADEPAETPADLVERCVREVLRILERAEER